jgi:hypothetical protein
LTLKASGRSHLFTMKEIRDELEAATLLAYLILLFHAKIFVIVVAMCYVVHKCARYNKLKSLFRLIFGKRFKRHYIEASTIVISLDFEMKRRLIFS